jgi:spermidine synthase
MAEDAARPAPMPQTDTRPVLRRRIQVWQPNLIVFVSSGCIMILELVAGRMIAPHVGVSLYTWTSVIGIVLAGVSLGNYVGGRLADHWASLRLLGLVYLLAALACLGVLYVDRMHRITPSDWPIVAEILVLTTALFFLPSTLLGMISPIVAKLAVSDLAKTGSTVGKIYAAGSLGSIVGTFATGFVLIAWLGTYTIIWGVALVLIALGLVFMLAGRGASFLLAAAIILGGSALALNQGWLASACVRETDYYCIKINSEEHADGPVRVLILDHLVHSYVSLNNPQDLIYGYEKMYAEIAAYQAARTQRLRTLMIGGGGYTFPRYIEAVYPGSDIDVVEIDPEVTATAYDLLGLNRDSKIVTFNEDTRLYLARPPTKRYDLIFGDAFNHCSVPYHLVTQEANDLVRGWLADGGLYVVNIIDGPQGEFARAYVNTLRRTFRHVYFVPGSDTWRETMRTTFVIIASDTPLDLAALASFQYDAGDALVARQLASPEEVERLLTEAPTVVLTDQYAPVDQMLASVFREETPK